VVFADQVRSFVKKVMAGMGDPVLQREIFCFCFFQLLLNLSGSRTRLPAPSSLRTVRAPFNAYGSSLY